MNTDTPEVNAAIHQDAALEATMRSLGGIQPIVVDDYELKPDLKDPRWKMLKDVNHVISENGIYWGKIDQNTIARVFRSNGSWFECMDDPNVSHRIMFDPPFRILIEDNILAVPTPAGAYTGIDAAWEGVRDPFIPTPIAATIGQRDETPF